LKRNLSLTFQLCAVFIGTIVGAGLASGQEITLFFTRYGHKSFKGLLICMIIYIFMGFNIIHTSIKYNLKSYNDLIKLVSPGILGKVTGIITGVFLISSSSIILAGSGALLHQYFNMPRFIGTIIMACIGLFTLLRNTDGLIEVNSFIVPCLLIVITTIFILFITLSRDIATISYIKTIPKFKNNWFISCLLYGGFNILACSGVLVPLSSEVRNESALKRGLILGSIGLTALGMMINFMLLSNVPNIYKYDIPLLYIAHRFGVVLQVMLLVIIWLEMFSTEVSDIYSLSKTLQQVFNISYKKAVVIILLIDILVSRFGFVNLIRHVYPFFGAISLIFMIQYIMFKFNEPHKKK
jgi:uncharacterized membrane protein YkvI